MAGQQSSGTFVPIPGESLELKAARAAARVEAIELLDEGSGAGFAKHRPASPAACAAPRSSGSTVGRDHTEDGCGWIEILDKGLIVTIRGKTGWREVEIGRGSVDATCPVASLQTWLTFARISHGPLFRRVTGNGRDVAADRLTDRQVARLVKRAAMAAGVRSDLAEGVRAQAFSGHSLRAGLASSAEVDERYVQKHLGHASAEMTRRYQRRRDRFRVNLTKAAGL